MAKVVNTKENTKSRVDWGKGRQELAVLHDEIIAALSAGSSKTTLHREFVADGRITLSYRQFAKYVSKIREGLEAEEPIKSDYVTPSQGEDPSRISTHSTSNNDDFIDASASVVPLQRVSGAGGFKLNPDFNLEE